MAYERNKPGRGGTGGSRSGGFGGSRDGGKFSGSRDGAGSGGPRKSFGDRKPGGFSGSRDGGKFGGSRDGARGDRPQRDFNDRPPRREGGFNDRPPRRDGENSFGDRPPRRDFNDRPPRRDSFQNSRDGARDDRPPRRDFGDRPPRRDSFQDSRDGARSDRPPPRRDFNDRPPRREGGFNDRPPRREGGSSFGDRPPRRDFSDRPPRRDSFGGSRDDRGGFDRPQRREYSRDDRPQRDHVQDTEVADTSPMAGHELVLYGVHAVQAALKNLQRKITKIWATEKGLEHLEGFHDAARHPAIDPIEKRDLEKRLGENTVHQGIAMAAEPLPDVFMSDILAAANAPDAGRHVVVILDEVSDPHNVGAVLRSMSVFGAKAMIVHKRNAPSMTAAMAKIATGAVEHVPMIPVVNLGGAIEELKNAGFFCLGLDENADYPLSSAPTDGHMAIVLGAEGEGLREKTRSLCDAIANIPALGEIKSLNVSNAAAIALYVATQSKE